MFGYKFAWVRFMKYCVYPKGVKKVFSCDGALECLFFVISISSFVTSVILYLNILKAGKNVGIIDGLMCMTAYSFSDLEVYGNVWEV